MDENHDKIGALLTAKKAEVERNFRKWQIPAASIPDLRQDTFRAAFEHVRKHGVQGDLGGLLQKIGDDLAKNFKMRAHTRTTKAQQLALDDVAPSNPEKDAAQREINATLYAMLEAIPPGVCEIVWLRFIEDLTTQEIAAALGMSESTVKRRIADFRTQAQKDLRKRGITSSALLLAMLSRDRVERQDESDGENGGSSPESNTNPGVTLESPAKAPPSAEKREPKVYRWCVASAAAAGIFVWWLMRTTNTDPTQDPQNLQASAPVMASPGSPTSTNTKAPTQQTQQTQQTQDTGAKRTDCPVCSDVSPPPPPPPCSNAKSTSSTPDQPEVDSSNRDIARACEASIRRKDKDEARRWCPHVKGDLRAALAPLIAASHFFE